ncbi:Flp family type IVb pilin [Sphingomonas sp. RS2018]
MTTPRRSPARSFLTALRRNRKGATAIEYGLVVTLIAVTIIGAMILLGDQSQLMWGNIHSATVKANGG